MAAFIDTFVFLLFLTSFVITILAVKSKSKSVSCDSGFFFDTLDLQCRKCSVCPANHIIDKPCSPSQNIKCIPWTHQNPLDHFVSHVKPTSKGRGLNQNKNKKRGKVSKQAKVPSPMNNEVTSVDSEDQYWKSLAFALIGLLSVLIIATFIVLIFVYKKLQRSIVIKQSEEGDLMDDADSGYVVIRTIHHLTSPRVENPYVSLYPREPMEPRPPRLRSSDPTNSIDSGRPADSVSTCTQPPMDGRLCFLPKMYQPQRRMLNYDADDVFESDDSVARGNRAADRSQVQGNDATEANQQQALIGCNDS